jgi:hypothetical protein
MKNLTPYGHFWVSNGTNALYPFICQRCGALYGTERSRNPCEGKQEK